MKNSITHIISIPDEELSQWAELFDIDTDQNDWQDEVTSILVICHQFHHNHL